MNDCGGSAKSISGGTLEINKPHSTECIGFQKQFGSLSEPVVNKIDQQLQQGMKNSQVVCISIN